MPRVDPGIGQSRKRYANEKESGQGVGCIHKLLNVT